jgi:hypothetical protein
MPEVITKVNELAILGILPIQSLSSNLPKWVFGKLPKLTLPYLT